MQIGRVRVGCAGWTIPKLHANEFPAVGSHLQRYGQRFPAVEINSSFNRSHTTNSYARWREAVPEHFQFSVKMPRDITHVGRLTNVSMLSHFLSTVGALGDKLGPLLVQLPPSLAFDARTVTGFFEALRKCFSGSVVCEPRHPSWFTAKVDRLLTRFKTARVAADPAPLPEAARPGGWDGLVYFRLHGSPKKYYSAYTAEYLETLARSLIELGRRAPTWCIFDNTASGAATANALSLQEWLLSFDRQE
jgi:uncharacterized protein YecE (DUF72 family)